MELRQLRCFIAVAETLHFARAAEQMYVTPSALSQQIRRLERETGCQLFERNSRRVVLTEAGTLLVPRSRAILQQVDQTLAEMRAGALGGSGRLRIGVWGPGAAELTPLILKALRASRPEVTLELRELDFLTQTQALERGEVDVALVRPPLDAPDVSLRTLAVEPQVAMLPAAHPLAEAETLAAADLLEEVYVGVNAPFPRGWVEHWSLDAHRNGTPARRSHLTPRSVGEVNMSVAAGLNISTAAASLMRFMPHPGVAYVPVRDAAGSAIAVATSTATRNPLAAHFADLADRIARDNLGLLPGARREDAAERGRGETAGSPAPG